MQKFLIPSTQSDKICAFTGHRLQKLGWGFDTSDPHFAQLRQRLFSELLTLVSDGYTRFISGGAQGFDLIAAEEVLKIRQQLPFVELNMALPCPNQIYNWTSESVHSYNTVLKAANSVKYISDSYAPGCMFMRNRYMVDNCNLVYALYNGTPGGTASTVNYARFKGVPVRFFPLNK